MPLLSPKHSAALTDAQTWTDNPFFRRDARRDIKRRQVVKSLAWMAIAMLLFGGPAAWGLTLLMKSRFHAAWWLGGDFFTALCIVISGLHIWFIAGASQKHTNLMMTQEAFRNTLPHLLMLPAGPFHTLLQAALYPWWAAMRLALLLLPIYIFFVGIGSLSWVELAMLYVVFALVAFTIPVWRRPALADNVAITTPAPQRAPTAATNALSGQANTAQATGATGMNNGMSLAFFLPFFLFFTMSMNRRGFGGMFYTLRPYLPDSLLTLMPTSMLSWPLLVARGMITPLDWYGFAIPPLPFFLLLFLVSRYLLLVRTSEFMQVGAFRDLAFLPTYLPRRRWEGALRIVQLFVALGYLWRWAIWNGGLDLLTAQPTHAAPGLDSFVYLLLFLLAARLLARCSQIGSWLRGEKPNPERLLIRVLTFRSALRYLLEPIAFTIGFYLLCCAISRTAPFPHSVLILGGRMLALIGAGALLSFGVERFSFWGLSALLRIVVFFGPFVGALYYHIPQARLLAYFSPTLGLIGLGNPSLVGVADLYQPPMPWENWLRYGGSVGLLFTLLGLALLLRRKPVVAGAKSIPIDPTLVGFEVYTEDWQAKKQATEKTENPLRQRLVTTLQWLWDNAVVIREVRGRMRGRQDLVLLRYLLIVFLVATLALYQGMPAVPQVFGEAMARSLLGPARLPAVQGFANILACWYILLIMAALFTGFATGKAFAPERDKSTLGFLLMTPMSGSAIVLGKAAGILLANALIIVAIILWSLVMSLGLFPLFGPIVVWVWFVMTITALLLYTTVGMGTLAAASLITRWTMSPTAWAWILVILFQIVFVGGQFAWRPVANFIEGLGWSGAALWCALLTGCVCFSALSYLVAVWGIYGMRKRDLSFAASKREN